MIDRVIGNKLLPANIRKDIIERTDGIPLFVEEMTKAVLEAGGELEAMQTAAAVPSPALAVPASLHASLMARLDRLGPAKEVAQIGAAIGREFSHALLAAVVRKPEPELGLVTRPSDPGRFAVPQGRAAARDLFVQACPGAGRRLWHLAAPTETRSSTLVSPTPSKAQFAEIGEAKPELLGRHCAEAGRVERAMEYYLQAGRASIARSALHEAVAQLRRGLGLLKDVAENADFWRREFDLQIALGQALIMLEGHTTEAANGAYRRAHQLCGLLGRPRQIVPVLWGLGTYHLHRAELHQAMQIADEMLELGETWGDARIMATACMRSGVACFGLGDLGTAQAVLERGLSLFNPADRPFYSAFSIQDLQVTLLNFLSHTLFCLGHIDRSVQSLNEALSISESLSHPYTRAHALAHVCWTGWMTDPREKILAAAEAAVRLSTEHDFAFYLGMSMVFQGWAMTGGESTEEALATIERGLAMCAEIGAVSYRPLLLVVSAAAYANSGRPEQGLARIAEAREVMARADERWAEAELLRMNGRLLLACNEHAAAEAAFDDAMKIARSQNARTWELRSAMSMARLWSDQGKRQAARELLAPVYDWFTEGFNTLDLREAKALLRELS